MRLVRAALDTNVLVSAAGGSRGAAGQVLQALADGAFELVLSESIIDELRNVLRRPKTRRTLVALTEEEIAELVTDLRAVADMTKDSYTDVRMPATSGCPLPG